MKKFLSATSVAALFAAGLLAWHPAPAQAASVSDAGAADVKKQVEDSLAFQLSLGKVNGGGLSLDGGVDVTPKDDHYEVQLKGLAFSQPEMGLKAKIGTVTGNVTPGDQGEYKITLSVPPSVTVTDDKDAPVGELSVGSQQFTGTWWPKYHAFTQFDAAYGDIKLTSKKGDAPLSATVGTFKDTLTLTPQGDIWSGPSKFDFSQVHINAGPKGQLALTIDDVAGTAEYDKMNLSVYRQMEEKTTELLAAANKSQPVAGQQSQALLSSMMTGLQSYIDGMETHLAITNLAVSVTPDAAAKQPPGAKPDKPFALRAASVTTTMKATGLQEDKGGLVLGLGLQGLNVQDLDDTITGVVPTAANIEVHLENLPIQSMAKQFSALISQVLNGPLGAGNAGDPTQKAAMQQQLQTQAALAMAAIPAQLTAAGSKVSITNTYTQAPDIATKLEGAFIANTSSPLMATGDVTLEVTGLTELLAKIQTRMQSPGADPHLTSWYQSLGMAQMMGKAGKAADGRSQTVYKVELTPDGKTLLNGKDPLAAMGGGMGAPGAGPGAVMPAPKAP